MYKALFNPRRAEVLPDGAQIESWMKHSGCPREAALHDLKVISQDANFIKYIKVLNEKYKKSGVAGISIDSMYTLGTHSAFQVYSKYLKNRPDRS